MGELQLQEQIAAGKAYEALFVEALFRQWPPLVADAARLEPGQRVLDVACGTGVLARAINAHTGPTGYVAGLDPNPGMLSVATEIAPHVDWRQGVAESLPFPDRSFDAVVSQFGLMFFTDRQQALREMLRVLVPGGRMVVAVWDSVDHIPAYAAEVALLERHAGARAADALRAPFVLGDRENLRRIFEDAGVTSVSVTTHRGTAHFPGVRVLVEADLRGWLPVMGVNLDEVLIGRILDDAEEALGAYVDADGRVAFDTPAHLVTGMRP